MSKNQEDTFRRENKVLTDCPFSRAQGGLWQSAGPVIKTFPEILRIPTPLLPALPQWDNYQTVWEGFAYYRFFLNSRLVAAMVIAGTVFTCCSAAYAFALQ